MLTKEQIKEIIDLVPLDTYIEIKIGYIRIQLNSGKYFILDLLQHGRYDNFQNFKKAIKEYMNEHR